MAISDKLTYLGETKSILKDTINMSNANITNSTTFRNYATQLKEGYIDILNNGTDTLYNNFTHLTGKGMTLSFAPTYQAPMKITCYGSTTQETTTGKNLVDFGTQTFTTYKEYTGLNIPAGTYNFSAEITSSDTTYSVSRVYFYTDNDFQGFISLNRGARDNKSITLSQSVNRILLYASADYASSNGKTATYKDMQLQTGSQTTPYEQYTGGIPSPNPNYSQTINTTTGNQTISVSDGTNTDTYNIGLGNIELCKIGDYEDKIDKSTGKNKMPIIDGTVSLNGITITVKDGYVIINGTSTGSTTFKLSNGLESVDASNPTSAWLSENCVSNKNNTTLSLRYISGTGATSGCAFRTYADTTTYLTQFYPTETEQSTTYNTTGGISCLCFFTTSGRTFNNYKFAIQLESGNSVTDYEPYGTDWYLKKNIGKVVLDGSESWAFSSSSAIKFRLNISNAIDFIDGNQNNAPLVFTNRYQPFAWNSASSYTNGVTANTNQLKYLCFKNNDITTLEAWQTDLATNNIIVYYPLATPTYTKITDSTLIEQLEAIKSKDNTTNITSSMVIGAIALKKE